MPTFSADYLRRLAADTGFRPDTLEKVLRLGRILDQVCRHPFLADRLALNLGYRNALGTPDRIEVDLNYLHAARWPYDAVLLRRLFVLLSAGLDRPLTDYEIPHRASLSQTELEEALMPVLRGDERPRQAGLTAAIVPLMTGLAALSDSEREYIERIQWGEFLPELVVGDDPELLDRVRRHPVLLWKVENGRRRRRPAQSSENPIAVRRRGPQR